MSFFTELKRRNVFKVAIAYIVTSWLVAQVAELAVDSFGAPDWVMKMFITLLALGLPFAVIFAWAFEMTPEGLKKEKEVDRSQSITGVTGQKMNNAIIGVLVIALGYFAIDKFVRVAKHHEELTKAAQTEKEQTVDDTEIGATDEKSIAVLPFVNMSSDQEQEYFSDGLSEELLNLLAKIPDLRVAARTSSFSFKGQNVEIPEIASRLNVAHILEGSVRKSGKQLRITAQLIQADNGYHLWSETYDRQLDNIFQIQDDIAAAVVAALKITLLGEAPTVRETDPIAYQLFLEGQSIRRQISAPTIPKAIALFKRVLAIDPVYAPAWAELAYAYMWGAGLNVMPIEEGYLLAEHAIEMAIESDPDYAWAYFVRGVAKIFNKFDFKGGAEDYQLALQLDPGNSYFISANGGSARVLGRLDESLRLYQTAIELDPLMAEIRSWQGLAYQYASQLDQAETAFRTTLILSPEYSGGHYRLGRVLLKQGKIEEGLAEMKREASSVYNNTGLAMAHYVMGDHEASQSALDTLIRNHANSAALQVAEVYGYRDEHDKAFEWLEESLAIRDPGLAGILGNPAFLGLRTDPRWQAFLAKLGLLEFWLEMPPEHGGPTQ